MRHARYRLPRGMAGAAPGGTNHRGSAAPRDVGASPTRVRGGRNLGLGTLPGGHLTMLRVFFLLTTVVPAEVRFDGAQSRPSTRRVVSLWAASVSRSSAAACSSPPPRRGRRGSARLGLWAGRVTVTWQAVVEQAGAQAQPRARTLSPHGQPVRRAGSEKLLASRHLFEKERQESQPKPQNAIKGADGCR